MKQNAQCEPRIRELIDADLPPDELERLARVDALLRSAAPGHHRSRGLRLVETPPARADERTHELRLSFAELTLIYRSLQAAKTLGVLPPQDELLDDTIQLVDQALNELRG